jgi:hypothetical protein
MKARERVLNLMKINKAGLPANKVRGLFYLAKRANECGVGSMRCKRSGVYRNYINECYVRSNN